MNIALFYHSVVSDWNHGNAHFLRGIVTSLQKRGNRVRIFEPEDSWSRQNLVKDYGKRAIADFKMQFPEQEPEFYKTESFNPAAVLKEADLVIVHEWNDPQLIRKIGAYKSAHGHFILLFHDTHHRSVTNPEEMRQYDLTAFDGVLAFGEVIKEIYLQNRWARQAWTWHEAADTTVFHPIENNEKEGDLVWIGNWGDDERTEELKEFIIQPVKQMGLRAAFYGVRYPSFAVRLLEEAGISYKNWVANYKVPALFSKYRVTVHVPRGPYVEKLPGIPTIRPFEAMASGIPLICSPWKDAQHLFSPGKDYLVAEDGHQMILQLQRVLTDQKVRDQLTTHAWQTIQNRHTCDKRVDELFEIIKNIEVN